VTIKRVGLITSSPKGGQSGSELSASQLLYHLSKRGIKVYTVSFPDQTIFTKISPLVEVISTGKLSRYELNGQAVTLIARCYCALKKLESYGVDIIHTYNVSVNTAAGIYKAWGGKCPVVATLNNYGGVCPFGYYMCNAGKCTVLKSLRCTEYAESLSSRILSYPYCLAYGNIIRYMKKLDMYIALSKSVKDIYSRNGYDECKIKVVPNFYERSAYAKSHCGNKNRQFNVLYVGALFKHKGVETLLDAFKILYQSTKDCMLYVVGNGPTLDCLKRKADEMGIANRVIFTGQVQHSEVWKYYEEASVFVHPGLWAEPFPRTLLEAMAFKLPCIVSNLGAPPEVVQDAGLIFEPGNAESLYRNMMILFNDKNLRLHYGDLSVENLKHFDPDNVVNRIIDVYHEAISGNAKTCL
jgi:starch synthase